MPAKLNYREIVKRILWGIIVPLILGIIAGIITNELIAQSPKLVVWHEPSYKGGQSVVDVIIANKGDFELSRLEANFELTDENFTYTVCPEDFTKYAKSDSNRFSLIVPPDVAISPKQQLEIRFTARHRLDLEDGSKLANCVSAEVIQKINGKLPLQGISWMGVLIGSGIFVVILLIIVIIILTIKLHGSKESDPQEMVLKNIM